MRGGEGEGEEDEGGLEENRNEEEERSQECRQVWWTSDPLWGGCFSLHHASMRSQGFAEAEEKPAPPREHLGVKHHV